MSTPYQPFLIGQGKFTTGLFNYLPPWQGPADAFDPMENAYVYRGSIYKRSGYTEIGRMTYRDNGISIATGSGISTYNGILAKFPIKAGSMIVVTTTSAGIETFTDNGAGVLTGSLGSTGTIVYTTGVWTLIFGIKTVAGGIAIRASYTYIPNQLSTPVERPIMGLKQWTSATALTTKLVAMDTRRAAVYNDASNSFDPLSSILQTIWIDDNTSAGPIDITTGWTNLAPYSVTVTYGLTTITDDGLGGFTGIAAPFAAGTTVNYSTGVIHLVLVAPGVAPRPSKLNYESTFNLQGDYFTGDETNFFNATNGIDPAYIATPTGTLYFVNAKDQITAFNGFTLSRPPFSITQANYNLFVNDITTALDLDFFKNRFLIQRPQVSPNLFFDAQSIRYSAINSPTNLIADVIGNGGETSASVDDIMQSSEFLRDQFIVFFTNSVFNFKFTGNTFEPFRWDKLNFTKSTNAPYATVPYDERITTVGKKGLIACDGVNVQRYDVNIIDQFLEINQNRIFQCFAQRFDLMNSTWILYPSEEENASVSDNVLVYNFLENTWSTFNIPMSCLGLYFITHDRTWAELTVDWKDEDTTWGGTFTQDQAYSLIGGNHKGTVFQMYTGETDDGTNVTATVKSNRLNPFIGIGQKIQFGYIDFYYVANSLPPVITLNFYTDNSSIPSAVRTLTLDYPSSNDSAMKRIYLNNIGEFIRFEMISNSESAFQILGIILWARPAGRLTP